MLLGLYKSHLWIFAETIWRLDAYYHQPASRWTIREAWRMAGIIADTLSCGYSTLTASVVIDATTRSALQECRCATREYPQFDPACARHKEFAG